MRGIKRVKINEERTVMWNPLRWDYEEWDRSIISWMVFIVCVSWFVWLFTH